MDTTDIARQIAFTLKQKEPALDWAWVEHAGIVYCASVKPSPLSAATAVTQLIQYLFDSYIDHSFFILRKRIFTTEPPHPYSQGMVRLAAKRIHFTVESRDTHLQINYEFKNVCSAQDGLIQSAHLQVSAPLDFHQCTPQNAHQVLNELIHKLPKGPVLHDYNRSIAAVLTDTSGNILEYSPNQNSKNKTLHAELLMLQNYYRRTGHKIPTGSQIFVSLKPCLMCASAILHFSEQPNSIHVYYLNDDPGPLAQNTELEKAHLQTKLTSINIKI